MIKKETIDKVFDASRVEEVIGDFVQLKRSGSNFKGLSPFTDERTPSFMVSPVKQIWKDFSSGKGGNAVAFLMEHEHFSYPEAIRYLAKKYGIEVEETEQNQEEKEKAGERESMYLVSEFARDHFRDTLHTSEQGKAIGLTYFKERGFKEETIDKFQLGYCLDQWDGFTNAALDKGYQLEFLEKTGLTIVKDNDRKFDRFKGRVMFPIHSMSGRVLGFGGRILTNDKKAAKYLNSPESEIYHKSKVLYGLYQAKQTIAKEDNCFLVEGYTDVIQFHQSGVTNVVASSGTALTPEQIRLVNRLTKNITVLFDGDAAGLRASMRGIDLILEQGMNVKVVTFPDGEDPDSFASKNSPEELQYFLETNASDFIQFKAAVLVKEAQNDPVKKAATIRDIINSIAKIPDRIQREVYIQECSRIMDISEEVLFNSLAQLDKKEIQEAGKRLKQKQKAFEVVRPDTRVEKIDYLDVLERKIIELLLLYGTERAEFHEEVLKEDGKGNLVREPAVYEARVFEKIYLDLQEDEVELSNPLFREVYNELIVAMNEKEDFTIDGFLNQAKAEVATELSGIMMEDEKYALHNWQKNNIYVREKRTVMPQLVSETILSLRCELIGKKVDALQEEITNENDGTQNILEDIMNYHHLRKLLSDRLNRVL